MKRSSLASFVVSSVAASLALVVAATSASCSDSGSGSSSGGSSGTTPDATVSPTDAQGADVAVDSASDAASSADADAASSADADGGARVCALPASDAGSRTLIVSWTATAPVLVGAATVVGQIVQPDCTVVLATGMTAAAPPAYTIYLEKKDTAAGSCASPKGFRYLFATYATPTAFLASHPSDPRLFVVAYNHKNTLSGSSPVQLSMQQVDWDSGDMLHGAGFAVVGSTQNIPPAGSPTALAVTGCDVVLDGSGGTFPGASGAQTTAWTATYTHFLAPTPQDGSNADLAAYK
jgi:hypothetical protein